MIELVKSVSFSLLTAGRCAIGFWLFREPRNSQHIATTSLSSLFSIIYSVWTLWSSSMKQKTLRTSNASVDGRSPHTNDSKNGLKLISDYRDSPITWFGGYPNQIIIFICYCHWLSVTLSLFNSQFENWLRLVQR